MFTSVGFIGHVAFYFLRCSTKNNKIHNTIVFGLGKHSKIVIKNMIFSIPNHIFYSKICIILTSPKYVVALS